MFGRQDTLQNSVNALQSLVASLEIQLTKLNAHFESVQIKFEHGARRFERIDSAMGDINTAIAGLQKDVVKLSNNQRLFLLGLGGAGAVLVIAANVWIEKLIIG